MSIYTLSKAKHKSLLHTNGMDYFYVDLSHFSSFKSPIHCNCMLNEWLVKFKISPFMFHERKES